MYCNTSANQTYPEQLIGPNVPTIRSVVNGSSLAATLTGLNPYTQYSCYVTANTSVGEGSTSVLYTTITVESGNLLYLYPLLLIYETHKPFPRFASSIILLLCIFKFICSSIITSKLLSVSCCWFSISAVC